MRVGIFLSVVLLVSAGCASTYRHSHHAIQAQKLNPAAGVLILVPTDGWYGSIRYPDSGIMTVRAIEAAFSKRAKRVGVVRDCDLEECLKAIDVERYGYFVWPKILHWEERATEWSGKPDRIEIQITIYDTKTKQQIAKSSYTGKSKWATFGGDHPQDLLPEPTNAYVSSLYR